MVGTKVDKLAEKTARCWVGSSADKSAGKKVSWTGMKRADSKGETSVARLDSLMAGKKGDSMAGRKAGRKDGHLVGRKAE